MPFSVDVVYFDFWTMFLVTIAPRRSDHKNSSQNDKGSPKNMT